MTSQYASYLFAWVFWLCFSLGCLGLLLLHHLFRAAWGRAALPVLEAGARTLPVMAVLLLPILAWGMPELYPWVRGDHAEAIMAHRAPYLNVPFFLIRAAAYFGIWIGLAAYLTRSTARERRTGDASLAQRRTNVSAPGLVAFVLTVTFAMTDWVMSAEKHWFSTIYGVWFISGQALAAVALVVVCLRREIAVEAAAGGHGGHAHGFPASRDLGYLMLAFTLFWAYISLSQYLIIWSANLPEETTFYLIRSGAGWQAIGALLIVGQFAVPFLALLSGKTKRNAGLLAAVGALVLAMRALDVYWIVMPSVRSGGAAPTVADAVAFIAVGFFWGVSFTLGLRGARRANAEPTTTEASAHAS
jgi:hypothetical protein